MENELKRRTRIEYAYAGGKVVQGKIIGPYSPDMPDWFLCELEDEFGTYRSGCHRSQLKVAARSRRGSTLAIAA